MNIIGIDYSVNSPAVVKMTVNENYDLGSNTLDINYIGFSDVKKTAGLDDNIFYYNKKQFSNYIEKILWFHNRIWEFMDLDTNDVVAIEGYAFAAQGKVFNIAEATFPIKLSIYNSGNKLRIYEPNLIKKFSVLNGNANKEYMLKYFEKDYDIFKHLPDKNPKEDLIDAFYVCELLRTELRIRKGLLSLKELKEKQIEVFNQVSKANKDNLLVRDFLQKP